MSTRGQGHCLTFVQGLSDLYFQTYSQADGHIKVKFYAEPFWLRGTQVCFSDGGYMAKMAAMPICG